MSAPQKRIVLGVTGSIAAYKAAEIVRVLMERGHHVTVVLTKEAEHFVGALTFEGLSGNKVWRGGWDDWIKDGQMTHIELARTADAVLIAPATANIIAKLAAGLADDVLTCLVLATTAPIVLAPAMNEKMYHNRIVQENCQKLKDHGMIFAHPVRGQLACGIEGDGHLEEPENIVKVLESVI